MINPKDTPDTRKDSTIEGSDVSPEPIPFVVVEKVADKDQPEYGDVESRSLPMDESKRAADPDPDFEEVKADSPLDTEPLNSPQVPLVMVEKVDDKPAHGDDFGKDATIGQKLAHELRSADASPDQLIISPEEPGELDPAAQAPLFRHESFQDSEASLPEPAIDTTEEESVPSSTDHTSSGDAINTPSAESQDDDGELGQGPLLSHETGFASKIGELKNGPLFPHETGLEVDEDDKFTNGPLLSHETGFTVQGEHETGKDEDSDCEGDEYDAAPLLPHETGFSSHKGGDATRKSSRPIRDEHDYEEDEFDAAPLLPHETGFSSYKRSETTSEGSRFTKDGYDYEPEHYVRYGDSDDGGDYRELDHAPAFSHEQDLFKEDYGAPLLPHERGSAAESVSGSERSFNMSPTMYESAYPAFGQEIDATKELFGGSMRPSFFRTRTGSSTLPHKLPRSDAEDIDLNDPGLEAFPVGREQILERVATIGHKLPEDETHGAPSSPQPSVLSQACSSVDLVPVKSYTSLASVREDSEEEEDEENADVESLPSPVYMSKSATRFARDRDPLATPHPDDSKQLGFVPDDKPETQNTHAAESSEIDSVSKTDGAKDSPKGLTSLSDIIASKATVMNTMTPPLTPRALDALSGKELSTPVPEPEIRQRQEPAKEATESSAPTPRPEDSKDEDVPVADPLMMASISEKLKPNKSSLQSFFDMVFGDWKRAR